MKSFRIFAVLAACLISALPASAQDAPACAAIPANDARLACYDDIFPPVRDENAGDPLTILSEQLIPARPSGRENARMLVICDAGELRVLFSFANQLMSQTGDIAPISFQVDLAGTTVRSLRVSTDNTVVGYWTTAESNAFLDSILAATNLKVRVTPLRQRSLTVDFRITDNAEAIVSARAGCV